MYIHICMNLPSDPWGTEYRLGSTDKYEGTEPTTINKYIEIFRYKQT
jgi:hypothetical protein